MDPGIYAMVLDTLNRATSQDTEILKPAEKKLQEWEIEPGFYSVLLDILTNQSVDTRVRWLAVMCFKNGVDRYWRKNAPNAISDEEKQKLRNGLLTTNILNEPLSQIASQQAVLISKIARFDCPTNWPNLVPDLIEGLKSPNLLVQHRSLMIFHQIVNTLASKRLSGDRKTFQELTNTVYTFILNIWHENTETFLRCIQEAAETQRITEHLEKALLCLKILRKLTIYGFRKPHEQPDAMTFLNIIFDTAKTSLECRKLLKGRGIYPLELCEKFIIHLTKVAIGVLSYRPFSYVTLIRPSLEFSLYYCFTEQGMVLTYERFTIQCLNIVKEILQCPEYKLPKELDNVEAPLTLQAHEFKMAVLTEETVCHMCRHVVTKYLVLTPDDLALWDAEPESFAIDEAGESWKYSLKPCTEAVFMALFNKFRDVLAPELVRMLTAVRDMRETTDDLPAILRKDAVYNAVKLAAFDLFGDVDFDEWFTNVLSKELKIADNNYRIIRRRVCQLIGQWSDVRSAPETRPALYAALLGPLAAQEEDVAVKMAAADAMRAVVDEFGFDAQVFEPYAPHVFAALYDLLVGVSECDTKLHVLDAISCVVEVSGRIGAGGGASVTPLVGYLPQLWRIAVTDDILRAAVLRTCVKLIKASGECLEPLRSWATGLVAECASAPPPHRVYLIEDALDLWLALLEVATALDPTLLQLATHLPSILEQSTEYLRVGIYIMQAYAFLCPEEFLSDSGARCMLVLSDTSCDLRTEATIPILKVAEACLSVRLPERSSLLGVKVVWPLLLRVIHRLLAEHKELPMALSIQLCLLSRVILISTELFYKAIQEAAIGQTEYNCDPAKVLDRVLAVWTEKMNLVTQVERWKLVGLGLSALLTTQNPAVLQRFPSILLNLTEVLNDVMKNDGSGEYVDGLVMSPDSRPASPLEGRGQAARWAAGGADSPHEQRQRALAKAHPAYTHDLRQILHHQLETLKRQMGIEQFAQLVQSADRETLQQIREYINLEQIAANVAF